MENQGFTLEHCMKSLQTDADPHFRTQASFLDDYNCRYLLDLDDLQPVGHDHIDTVIGYMLLQEKPRSANTKRTEINQQLQQYKSTIETAYHADYELYYRDLPPAQVGVIGVGKIGSQLVRGLHSAGVTHSVNDFHSEKATVDSVPPSHRTSLYINTPTTS